MVTPVRAVLDRLERVKASGDDWTARCPAHEDGNPSLSVSEGDDGRALLKCFAGCSTEDVVEAMGLDLSDLFPTNNGRRQITATYDYVDEDGNLLYQVVRFRPKAFRQRAPDGIDDWRWSTKGVRRVLYRLPDVLEAAADGGRIFVVEGEKDADRLHAKGVVATTNAGGAGKWRDAYTRTLAGARVGIIADRDEPGREHAWSVARALEGTAKKVAVLEPKVGNDVSDHLAAGLGLSDLEVVEEPPEKNGDGPGTVSEEKDEALTLTDTGNSARLADLHGERLHFLPRWGKWLVEAGGFWSLDHEDVRVRELAKDVGHELKQQAADEPDTDRSKQLFKWGIRSLSSGRITAMVNLARGIQGVPLDYSELDADGWLLGVENGVVDLRTGSVRPADPSDLITRRCPVPFDPEADAPRWERAMEQWFPDEDLRAYVKRVSGAALVGRQTDHVLIIHYGPGANGKGTFVRAHQHVLGTYAGVAHLSLLVQQKHSEHDTVKADLFRKRLAVASETERRVKLREASVKNLTGGDRITARRMREDPWEFDPTHSIWLQTNHLPEIAGRDRGIWRRIRVVKWDEVFQGENADPHLDERLRDEAAGILRWMVEGCLEWQERGLDEPEAVVRETLDYRRSEDTLARFQGDVGLAFSRELEIQAGELQKMLTTWAEEEGVRPPRQEIGDWLRENGCEKKQRRVEINGETKRPRFWIGVGIPDEGHEAEQTDAWA